jgi:hypothetical protein
MSTGFQGGEALGAVSQGLSPPAECDRTVLAAEKSPKSAASTRVRHICELLVADLNQAQERRGPIRVYRH